MKMINWSSFFFFGCTFIFVNLVIYVELFLENSCPCHLYIICYVQMGTMNIQKACMWKKTIEYVIDHVRMIDPQLVIHSLNI
jgi:hypothetical protein